MQDGQPEIAAASSSHDIGYRARSTKKQRMPRNRRMTVPIRQKEVAHWEEDRRTSRYADNLPQLEAGLCKFGRHIPSDPRQWHCDETGVTDNLWLNLSTGFIGSGRQVRKNQSV